MPVHIKKQQIACPQCNPEKDRNGIMLFLVQAEGNEYYFCGKCLGEFKMKVEGLVQTKTMELDNTIISNKEKDLEIIHDIDDPVSILEMNTKIFV